MRNKQWYLTIFALIITVLAFAYVRGKVITEDTWFDANHAM